MKGRTPRESEVQMTQIVLPSDTNALGTIFGGTVMKWIDIAAAIAARRHCRTIAVTVSLDKLDFLSPVKLGNTVVIKAKLAYAGRTSMVVGVTVESEETETGIRSETATAWLTFVALDKKGKPKAVPPLIPESAEEKRIFEKIKKKKRKK